MSRYQPVKCVSGKNGYSSFESAKEALVQHHIVYNHRQGGGPTNIYECSDCGQWHFTSSGNKANLLESPEIKARIERERRAKEWEQKFR